MTKKIKIFSNIESLSKYSAKFLIKKTTSKLNDNIFSIAVSGGSTPKSIFKNISDIYSSKINWERINLFFGDERCVPPESDESNYKMVNNSLFINSKIPSENIFRIKGEKKPTQEAKRYSKILKENIELKNNIPCFDLILLGLGEDGHTASIFPEQLYLFNSKKYCEVSSHPNTGQNRITITGSIINNAKLVVFIVTGEKKKKIVSEILRGNNKNIMYPAALVNPTNGKLVWLLDTSASLLLNRGED